MKFLLVEDYVSYAVHVVERLEQEGHEVVLAVNMHQAVEAMAKHKFDIVITDFSFPGGNGDEVLKLVREAQVKLVYLNSAMPSQSSHIHEYTSVLQKDDLRGLVETVLGPTDTA